MNKGGPLQLLPEGDSSKAGNIAAKVGAVLWRPAETHIVKNAGTTTVELLEVEIKNLGQGQ